MASSINPLNIDGQFPVAGQDNDSQGFRTNFTNIRNNFVASRDEIVDLQNKAVLLQQLTGGSAVANNFNGTLLSGALTKGFTEYYFDNGHVTTGAPVVLANGDYQKFTVDGTGSCQITFNWEINGGLPNNKFAKVRVWFELTGASTLSLPAAVNLGTNAIPGLVGLDIVPVGTPPTNYIFEFTTVDGGVNTTVEMLVGPLGDATSAIITLQGDVIALEGNVAGLQSNLVSNAATVSGHTLSIGALNNRIDSIDVTLSSNVVLNNASNTLNGNIISRAAEKYASVNVGSGVPFVVDLATADFHLLNMSGNITELSFAGWSTVGSAYSKVRALLNITANTTQTVTFIAGTYVGLNANNVPGLTGTVFTAPTNGYYMFEFSSFDAGTTVIVTPLVKP